MSRIEAWIQNHFLVNSSLISDLDEAKEEFVEIRTKSVIKSKFQSDNLAEFWCSQVDSYPILAKRAMNMLIPFVTTYVCKAGLFTLLNIKIKNIFILYRAKNR